MILQVKLGDIVDMVIVNEAKRGKGGQKGHIMHFHGHHYYLLDLDQVRYYSQQYLHPSENMDQKNL